MSRIASTDKEGKEVRYSDFLMNFDVNPITGNLARVTNENTIKQQFRNRILTNRGERFYNITFGSTIKSRLFDLFTPESVDDIRQSIESAAKQEERINLQKIDIFEEDDGIRVDITFSMINIPDVQNLSILLKRIR